MHLVNLKFVLVSTVFLSTISQHQSQCDKMSDSKSNFNSKSPEANLEENASDDVFEGDIVVSEDEEIELEKGVAGAGIMGDHYRWPNRTIPYIISSEFTSGHRKIILSAMKEISKKTCMIFKQREREKNYIYVQNGRGCSSFVGRHEGSGKQAVTLNTRGCIHKGIIMHELVHAIGFWHEQSRTDRDKYIKIIFKNIKEANRHNFAAYTSAKVNDFGVPYDYRSIMHYRGNSFISETAKKKGLKTIVPRKDGVKIGQRSYLSELDVLKINRMYCPKRSTATLVTTTSSTSSTSTITTTPKTKIISKTASKKKAQEEAQLITQTINSKIEGKIINSTKLLSTGGLECVSECRKSGAASNWCFINKDSPEGKWADWDYCTPREDQMRHLVSLATDGILSSHGIPCKSKCGQYGYLRYHTCTTISPWKSSTTDYCSPTPGLDYRLRKCSSKCEYTANSYKWCYLEEGGSGFCSKENEAKNLPLSEFLENVKVTGTGTGTGTGLTKIPTATANGGTCATECRNWEGESFTWCKTNEKVKGQYQDYCSSRRGQDVYGRKCTSKCGNHGLQFKWCRIGDGEKGFCSR